VPQRTILVADDIETRTESGKRRSQAICAAASSLAERLRTGIDLLYVEDIKSSPPPQFDASRIRAWHSRHETHLAEVGRGYPVPVHLVLKSGSPAEQILKALRAKAAPELVVVGTQGRKGLKLLLIGSVAEEVIRHSKRPVLVVGPAAQEQGETRIGQKQIKILVATDLSKNSRAAEQYALSLARRLGAGVVLFHCLWDGYRSIFDQSMISGMVPFNLDEILAEIRKDSLNSLKQKSLYFQNHGVPCDYKLEDKAVLSSCAVYQEGDRGYALVVMGTHGRNALLNAFFGSTARETILNGSTPVITVHSPIEGR